MVDDELTLTPEERLRLLVAFGLVFLVGLAFGLLSSGDDKRRPSAQIYLIPLPITERPDRG